MTMSARGGTATLTGQVHDQIRADILAGAHAPGSPLRLAALAKAHGASMSVVREALVRLAEHHLVVLAPNQGFRVVEVSREDLVDLTDLRVIIEGLALRRSIEGGDVEWEARLVSAHHVLDRTPMLREDEVGTTEEWAEAHSRFHEALGAGCGSPRLMQIAASLRDGAELYRQLSGKGEKAQKRDIPAEHRELMELAVARDADRAVEALRRHFQRTTDTVLQYALP